MTIKKSRRPFTPSSKPVVTDRTIMPSRSDSFDARVSEHDASIKIYVTVQNNSATKNLYVRITN